MFKYIFIIFSYGIYDRSKPAGQYYFKRSTGLRTPQPPMSDSFVPMLGVLCCKKNIWICQSSDVMQFPYIAPARGVKQQAFALVS